jgi:hypothetical protein
MGSKPEPSAPSRPRVSASPRLARFFEALGGLQLVAGVGFIAMAALQPSGTTPMAIGVGCSFIINAVGHILGVSRRLPLIVASMACIVVGVGVGLR